MGEQLISVSFLDFSRVLGECLRSAKCIWPHLERVVERTVDGELGLADLSSGLTA